RPELALPLLLMAPPSLPAPAMPLLPPALPPPLWPHLSRQLPHCRNLSAKLWLLLLLPLRLWPIPPQPHKLQNVQPPPHFLPPPILRSWQGQGQIAQPPPQPGGCAGLRESATPDARTSKQRGAPCLRPKKE